jgi:hypothetical protein
MDLLALLTACALTVDPKLMHALVWHQSGGEPWAVSVPGEPNPRVYRSMNDAIRETRTGSIRGTVRVGLAGVQVSPARVSASVLLPCRNVAMAAVQISRNVGRCKSHPRLKDNPTYCALAVYRGSWQQPDTEFATEVVATAARGDAPNFELPPGTSTEIFDTADELPTDSEPPVVDITTAFTEQARGWSSTLFPKKANAPTSSSDGNKRAPVANADGSSQRPAAASPPDMTAQERSLFVPRSINEPAQ